MTRVRRWWGLILVVGFTARCGNAGEGNVLSISAAGVVEGQVYFDRNGNRLFDGLDTVLSQVRVRLVASGTFDTVASVVTNATGAFSFPTVPIGSYSVTVDTTTIGDSLRLVEQSASEIGVAPGDSVDVVAAVSFPLLSVRAARLLPVGRKVFVEGIVLSPRATFGDTTGHLADTSRAIRLTRLRASPSASIGDSMRFLGTVTTRDGQTVLDDAALFPLGISGGAAPIVTTAAVARTANGGTLDAALVFVGGVIIVDTATMLGTGSPPVNDFLIRVDDTPADTAGRLDVLLDGHAGFVGAVLAPLRPDSVVSVTGVLVPTTGGRWRLKPRIFADVVVQ